MYATYKMQNNIQCAGWWTVINFVIHVQKLKIFQTSNYDLYMTQPTHRKSTPWQYNYEIGHWSLIGHFCHSCSRIVATTIFQTTNYDLYDSTHPQGRNNIILAIIARIFDKSHLMKCKSTTTTIQLLSPFNRLMRGCWPFAQKEIILCMQV